MASQASSPRPRRRSGPSKFNYRRYLQRAILGGTLGAFLVGALVFLGLDLASTRAGELERLDRVAEDLRYATMDEEPLGERFAFVLRGLDWRKVEWIRVADPQGGFVAAFGAGGELEGDPLPNTSDPLGLSVTGALQDGAGQVTVQGSHYALVSRATNRLSLLVALLACALPLAYGASRAIYARFSSQVLDLVHVANAISTRRDFSIRAVRRSEEEIGILVDTFNHMVTQIELSEGQLRSEVQRAEAAKVAKAQFLATMSHEIRTPINGIMGMAQLLKDTKLTDEQSEFASTILSSTEGLLGIINEILDFSKVEGGHLELEDIAFSVADLLKACVEPTSILATEKGIELCCDVDRAVPDALRGDPTRLRQVLFNLVGNALKFTSQGEVVIRVGVVDDDPDTPSLRFEVRDSGIGIPADRIDRLFQPFTQVDAAHNRQFGGTGLGLAICKNIVEAMGGEMFVRSKEGQGSCFGFVVQLKRGEPVTASTTRVEGQRILVVDGNRTARGILSRALEPENTVVTVSDPDEAQAAFGIDGPDGAYDLVVVDIDAAPGLADAAPDSRSLPWVLLAPMARLSEARDMVRGSRASVTSKPVRREDLLWCIAELLQATDQPRPALPSAGPAPTAEDRLLELSVLVAEDNAVNQRIITRFLQKLGARFVLVENGQQALDAFDGRRFDLVLMDVQMPVMDGLQATRGMRQIEAQKGARPTPIVAMTANAMAEDRRNCEQAGFDEHLSKPLRFEELAAFLRQRFARSTPQPKAEEPALELYPGRARLGAEPSRPRRRAG